MMQIKELMTSDVSWCRPDDTLQQAARMMRDQDCGCLPVCEDDGSPKVLGVITDRDICMCALSEGKALKDLLVGQAMTENVSVCGAEDSVQQAEDIMKAQRVRRLPVSDDDGQLLGMVSVADLARAAEQQRQADAQDITEGQVSETLAAIVEPRAQ